MRKLVPALLFLLASPLCAQIQRGNVNSSFPAPPVSSSKFTFSHTSIGPTLVVGCSVNDYPKQLITSVSVNGTPLTREWDQQVGAYADTNEWLGVGLPISTVSITVTLSRGATNGHGPACFAEDYSGVNQVTPVEQVQSQSVPQNSLHPHSNSATCTYTAWADGDVPVMFYYATAYGGVPPNPAITATPVPTDAQSSTIPPQSAIATGPALSNGQTFSETWITTNSNAGVSISVGVIILKAQ